MMCLEHHNVQTPHPTSACSILHEEDEERAELQQQLAEAKCVIQQLAMQLDHSHDTQQQLAGVTMHLLHPVHV